MLTAVAARTAQPQARPTKLADEKGLYLLITPTGRKYWRQKYRFGGVEKVAAYGTFPEVSLAEARDKRDEARALLRDGVDPNAVKRERKAAAIAAALDTFGAVSAAWLADYQARANLPHGNGRIAAITALTAGLHIGMTKALDARPISAITASEVIAILKPIELKGQLVTAKKVRQRLDDVFGFAVRRGLRQHNFMPDLKAEFLAPTHRNHAAVTDADELGALLRACWSYKGQAIVSAALKLAALTFVRPNELRKAEWSEFDLDGALWTIPAVRMKGGKHDHCVPLSRQALAVLCDLRDLTGDQSLVFPGRRRNGKPMSENTVNAALRLAGYGNSQMVGHGWRTVASTTLNELGFPSDHIERQLGHVSGDSVRAVYNKAQYLPARRTMVQAYADHLDALRCKDAAPLASADA